MKDDLGNRMKEYEYVSRTYLTKRTPTIIRLDGKAFHSFTKDFQKPFDEIFMNSMWETAKYLCENIQGCKIAYVQSDEITLLLTDYEKLNTSPWFEKNIQKMVSVSASMATLAFNQTFINQIQLLRDDILISDTWDINILNTYQKKINTALFDSRVFNLPKEEVCNCFIWRQQDATKNSIQMVARSNFNHNELNKLNCHQLQEKLFQEKNINWNHISTCKKRGICVVKEKYQMDNEEKTIRSRWIIDDEIPIFSTDRNYIEKYL